MNDAIIRDEPCPSCRSKGKDQTGNHLIVFSSGNKYCNRCGYKEINKALKEDAVMLNSNDVTSYPIRELTDRQIKKRTCDTYGVRVMISEVNGEVIGHYYPVTRKGKLTGWKERLLPKQFRTVGDCKGTIDLFGQSLFPSGGKRLLITGGELDAMSAYQMLYEKYPDWEPAVVSLPKGENTSAVADNLDFINMFEEVLIYTDMDKPGRECAAKLCDLIGPKAKIVSTSLKDASDMLVAGLKTEFIKAYFNAKPHVPDGFVTVEDVYSKATSMPTYGRAWPWPTLTSLTYGRRDGEGMYIGAGVKCGKSSFIDQLTYHVTKNEGNKIALFKMEEEPAMTVRKVAGLYMKKPFHKPDGNFTQEELIEGVNQVKGKILMFDSYGATSWDRLKGAIRYAVVSEGCKDIVIDPLTRLTAGMDSGDANTELEKVADELSSMAKDLGFFYLVTCHLKAPQTGKPHEMGGHVFSNQFAGSRAMMRACYYMLGIERNKDPELSEQERNTSTFVLLEDRAFGNAGRFQVFYNKETNEYLEPTNHLRY